MAVHVVRPVADYKAGWTETPVGAAWSALDDATSEPSVPNTSDYITAPAAAASQSSQDLANYTLVQGERLAAVQGWLYAKAGAGSNTISAGFVDAGSIGIGSGGALITGTSYAWVPISLDGRLLANQAAMDGLGIIAVNNGTSQTAQVAAMYAEYLTLSDSYGRTIYDDRPALWWRCDESSGTRVRDYSGNGRTGTLQGNVNWTPITAPVLVPNGTGRCLQVVRDMSGGSNGPPSGILADAYKPFTQNSKRTLECWFQCSTIVDVAITTFASDGRSGSTGVHPTLEFFGDPDNGVAYAHFYPKVSSFPVGWYDMPIKRDGPATPTYPIGNIGKGGQGTVKVLLRVDTTHHMVWAYDDTRKEYWLYMDGKLVDKATSPGAYGTAFGFSATDPGKLTWGYRGEYGQSGSAAATAQETFDGYVAEIAVYERLLTLTDVQRHYQAGRYSSLLSA